MLKNLTSQKSKILVLGFILIILAGFFSFVPTTQAQVGITYYDATHPPLLYSQNSPGACTANGTTTYVTYTVCNIRFAGQGFKWVPTEKASEGLCTPAGGIGGIAGTGPHNSVELTCILAGGSWDGTKIIQNGKIVSKNASPSAGSQATDIKGTCYFSKESAFAQANNGATAGYPYTKTQCTNAGSSDWKAGDWTAGATDFTGNTAPSGTQATGGEAPKDPSKMFGVCFGEGNNWYFSAQGCLTSFGYYVLIVIPSWILYITAYMFNSMLALTLGTVLYNNNFLPEAWRIVRDFSNIFFILVLLYISIKMILGLGGAGVKKTVASVIVAALLINFSMFMTKVVIDASNILALIFYNKIQVTRPALELSGVAGPTPGGVAIDSRATDTYKPLTIAEKNRVKEQDIAGGIAAAFNPAKFINASLPEVLHTKLEQSGGFDECVKNAGGVIDNIANTVAIGTSPIIGTVGSVVTGATSGVGVGTVARCSLLSSGSTEALPFAIALGIEVTSAAIFLFAAYAFFIAGLAFIGRLIELWVLIIFSPFAFMSLSIPDLQKRKYFGFDDWSKRLISVSFMAPIFMFFLLLITKLIQIDIFKDVFVGIGSADATVFRTLFILAFPAVIYLTMLYKATKFAKEGAGEFGSAVIKYGQVAAAAIGGLTLAAASGGTSMALTATLGKAGSAINKNRGLIDAENQGGFRGFLAGRLRDVGKFAGTSSFDPRATKLGAKFKSATGINAGEAKQGFEQRQKARDEKRRKRLEGMKVNENDELTHNLHNLEEDLQSLLRDHSHAIEQIDKQIESARTNANDLKSAAAVNPAAMSRVVNPATGALMTNQEAANHYQNELENYKQQKDDIRNARGAFAGATVNGRSIRDLQVTAIPDAKNAIDTKNRDVARIFAEGLRTPGPVLRAARFLGSPVTADSAHARDITAHAIIMETKLPDSVAK